MIMKPQGYDEAQAFTGEVMSLPAGCYVCIIKQVNEIEEKGKKKLAILFDIAEGEQKGFYQKQFDLAKQAGGNAKWKGVHKQMEDGSSLPFFKGLMTSIEKSNPGFAFPWGQERNEKTLAGKKFGAVIGREQFLTDDGKKAFWTHIFQVRSLEGLKDAKVPEDKLLPDNAQNPAAPPAYGPADENGFMYIPEGIDEGLPFM